MATQRPGRPPLPENEAHSRILNFRLSPRQDDAFRKKASRFGGHSHVIRTLVIAFTENRITIEPPADQSLITLSK